MGYELFWTEEQLDAVAEDYSQAVADHLRAVLASKDDQLLTVTNPADLPQRFHNMFTLGDLKVAEIAFNIHGREFRAVCVVLHDLRIVAFYAVTDKAGQEKRLRKMRHQAAAIETAVRQRFDQEGL